ncbi:hypothetical protein N7519_010001 [Penicillium mononematosum]|uniref:uncharacterized protein n=1 Tax=Penicillium mononematosum TaxID=268346 RepID=UPI0025486ECC|nr:uncharacterized protein N7519_010001 [Penicillium mononematosum]KAJ6179540.1 hypothetical protein N7519_010001 [Penicillium mononematosum]
MESGRTAKGRTRAVKGTLSRDSPGSAKGDASISEPTKDLLRHLSLVERISPSHRNPSSAYQCQGETSSTPCTRCLWNVQTVLSSGPFTLPSLKPPTPSSDSETIVGETTLQDPKNDHHGEDTGKRPWEIQSQPRIENKLSVTISSH